MLPAGRPFFFFFGRGPSVRPSAAAAAAIVSLSSSMSRRPMRTAAAAPAAAGTACAEALAAGRTDGTGSSRSSSSSSSAAAPRRQQLLPPWPRHHPQAPPRLPLLSTTRTAAAIISALHSGPERSLYSRPLRQLHQEQERWPPLSMILRQRYRDRSPSAATVRTVAAAPAGGWGGLHNQSYSPSCRHPPTTTTPKMMQLQQRQQRRRLSFSYAGPRSLREILKVEMLQDKEAAEISDLWLSHHEQKERVVGMCLKGDEGTKVLERASQCRFYVQPIFRDDGFFMLISQFQDPNHFLLAYLEDYKMDPASATPLLTFAVFNDYAETKGLALVRADVLNASITDAEAYKVVSSVLANYKGDDEYGSVQVFNRRSSDFDVDDYISRMNDRWNQS